MRAMSTVDLRSGRSRQKQRTRDHLIASARQLIESGDTPSVDEVARHSGISRTTAYRYFPNRDALLAAAFPETAAHSLLPDPPPHDAVDRVMAVTAALIETTARTERQQRAMLRVSLDGEAHELPLRQGRAVGWYREALAPLADEIGDEVVDRVALALRAACGIESRVWLTDVAGLAEQELRELQLWMASALATHARTHPPLA